MEDKLSKYPVVVIASPNELKLVQEHIGFEISAIIITGIGYGNVFSVLNAVPRDTKIINIGYAGSNCLEIGSVYDISRVENYHPNVTYKESSYNLVTSGTAISVPCYTSSDFVLKTDIKTPCVFDMELYAIMSMGFNNVRSIKVVSDNLNYKEYEDNSKD